MNAREILVLGAILLVLATWAASFVVKSHVAEARKEKVRDECKAWAAAVMSFKSKYGDFPENLRALTRTQPDGTAPFMPTASLYDPWGHEYEYQPMGGSFLHIDIYSLGPHPGDHKSIIGNWE